MTDTRKRTVEELRKRNIRKRNMIRQMIAAHPEAFEALKDDYYHTADDLAKAADDQVRVMIGNNQVIEALIRIDAMEPEHEIPIDE